MTDAAALALALAGGTLLGVFYFGTLWLVVRRVDRLAWPAVWLGATGILRLAVVLGLFVLLVGTQPGRNSCDAALGLVGLAPLRWDDYFGGFETLLAGSAPVFWGFFLLTGVAVFVLRLRHPAVERPFAIPAFPLPPLVFCTASAYMLYASLAYAGWLTLLGVVPLAVGVVVWFCVRSGAKVA